MHRLTWAILAQSEHLRLRNIISPVYRKYFLMRSINFRISFVNAASSQQTTRVTTTLLPTTTSTKPTTLSPTPFPTVCALCFCSFFHSFHDMNSFHSLDQLLYLRQIQLLHLRHSILCALLTSFVINVSIHCSIHNTCVDGVATFVKMLVHSAQTL